MDPQVSMQINPREEGTQDFFVDLDRNIFETQIELGLVSELKSLVKEILGVMSQSSIDLVKITALSHRLYSRNLFTGQQTIIRMKIEL